MKTGRGHCSGRLILLIAASLLSAFTLYFTSRGSPIGALDEQWQFYQLATSKNYAQDAKKATSALQALFQKDIEIPDLAERGRRVSALSNLFRALIKDPRINRDEFFYFRNREFGYWKALSPTYLPWAAPARPETGIVLCVGVKDFVLAVHNIQVLRNVLGSTLPIEIFYAGDGDLPEEKRKEFEALGPNIQTRNILNDFDDGIAGIGEILTGNGFVMKPFALLASRFERVILLDADIIFLQRPDASFDEDIHLKKTGTLFYHDRAVTESANTGWTDTLAWIKERVLRGRQPSTMLEKSIFWTAKLEHQQESGVVFMDKAKPGVFVSLLFATWMNTKAARAYLYKHVYGDKETYWLACELTSTPYYFNPFYPGMIGHYDQGAPDMCSVQMLHVDSNQKPLWFNAGLRKNKKSESKEYVNLTHYIPAGVRMEEQPKWRYMKRGLFCTDTKSERVKSMEGAGLTQLVENITVEARKVDEHFKTIEKGKSATNN